MRFLSYSWAAALTAATLIIGIGSSASAQQSRSVTFAGWGGVTQDAERAAYFNTARSEIGLTVREDRHSGFASIKAHVTAGNVFWDVVGTGFAECERAAANDLAEPLDYSKIDTTGIPKEFIKPNYVGLWTYSYGVTYRTDKFGGKVPQGWVDFWNVKDFPGRRSLWASGRYVLEAALMADGVDAKDVYKILAGPGGVDRAFKKLEEIKPHVAVWWTSQGQAMQLIRDGEVDMILLANGRASALVADGAKVGFQFKQAMMDTEGFMVLKGARNKDLAYELINYSLKAKPQALFTQHIEYGPTNTAAYDAGIITPEMRGRLPTAPENLKVQGIVSPEWYASKAGEEALARLALFLQR
jgi:putative spermidine/putrescine transport system substrate-binding protein